ncbi:hypothetical protein CRUP_023678 [Coryphaenoides rupestris]|nr:hypothetical protein CRUP_023678 [Coryphaenoides rupestris]
MVQNTERFSTELLGCRLSPRGCRLFSSSSQGDQTPPTPPAPPTAPTSMLRHLVTKIKATGPISVAEYMREVLTNPVRGYYVNNDMLGPQGDFITSPEISQVFGEAQVLTGVHHQPADSEDQPAYLQGTSATGLPVSWYRRLDDVPAGRQRALGSRFSVFLAHEFFDALPIHKFQRTPRGWREVMVDVDPERSDQLRFVIVPAPTLASSALLQGFKGHQLHPVLEAPGSADLTADVDFCYLRKMAARRGVLLRRCQDRATRDQLLSSYRVLTHPDHMGQRFLFLCLLHQSRLATPPRSHGLKMEDKIPTPLPVAGFTELAVR